jgi:hypothetical protein
MLTEFINQIEFNQLNVLKVVRKYKKRLSYYTKRIK